MMIGQRQSAQQACYLQVIEVVSTLSLQLHQADYMLLAQSGQTASNVSPMSAFSEIEYSMSIIFTPCVSLTMVQ